MPSIGGGSGGETGGGGGGGGVRITGILEEPPISIILLVRVFLPIVLVTCKSFISLSHSPHMRCPFVLLYDLTGHEYFCSLFMSNFIKTR